jgi:hypothetical protein
MRCFARMPRGGSGKGSIEGKFALRNQRETWSDFCGDVLVSAPAVHPLYNLGLLLRLLEIFHLRIFSNLQNSVEGKTYEEHKAASGYPGLSSCGRASHPYAMHKSVRPHLESGEPPVDQHDPISASKSPKARFLARYGLIRGTRVCLLTDTGVCTHPYK